MKLIELAEIAMLTSLIRETITPLFIAHWKPLMDILCKTEKDELMICCFDLTGYRKNHDVILDKEVNLSMYF